jgi:hypothetical protein
VADILQNFLLEHWKTGEHRFPLSAPANPRPGQIWFVDGALYFANGAGVSTPSSAESGPHSILQLSGVFVDSTNEQAPIIENSGTAFGTVESSTMKTMKVYLPSNLNTLRWQAQLSYEGGAGAGVTCDILVDGSATDSVITASNVIVWVDGGSISIAAIAGRPKWADFRIRLKSSNNGVDGNLFGISVYLDE